MEYVCTARILPRMRIGTRMRMHIECAHNMRSQRTYVANNCLLYIYSYVIRHILILVRAYTARTRIRMYMAAAAAAATATATKKARRQCDTTSFCINYSYITEFLQLAKQLWNEVERIEYSCPAGITCGNWEASNRKTKRTNKREYQTRIYLYTHP